jgi:hypothetical protein
MPYGNEVVLGFAPEEYPEVAKALGIELPFCITEDDSEERAEEEAAIWNQIKVTGSGDWLWDHGVRPLNERAIEAHHEALKLVGFTEITPVDRARVKALTPLGWREFCPFSFELFYDPHECDDEPEMTTFGVALSGRYCPTFLDWKDEHGTLYPVRFDQETDGFIAAARSCLVKRWPIFTRAHIAVVLKFY